jgi:uncharacterized protein (DUF2252 family)
VPKASRPALDPIALAERQMELDRERTKRFPELHARKMLRMSASPLAFLRGAAPLFYEMLAARPDLAAGPPGPEGFIVGDMHLENFGAYRPDAPVPGEPASARDDAAGARAGAGAKKSAVFDLNDFDDAIVGPWRLDVLRLTVSLLLGGRELGASGVVALSLVDRLLEAWAESAFDEARQPPEPPEPVRALIEQVRSRSKTELLDARTKLQGGKRRFVRGPRYADLPKGIADEVPDAFARYAKALPERDRPQKASLEILDFALRIAGTGSLGGLRVAVLVKGKGGPDGAWIFDMKEQGAPSAAPLLGAPAIPGARTPAERVVVAFRACVERPPRMIATTTLGDLSLFVRRLSPQEDKLNLRRLRGADLPALATYLGALLGAAHRRGATKPPKTRWAKADVAAVRDHAIYLGGIHEAVYLALCERMRHVLPEAP